jgi:hypothetical protein
LTTDLQNRVCPECMESNLIQEIKIAKCAKCEVIYCGHLASNIDPAYCVECLSDVTLIREKVTKEYHVTDDEGEVIHSYKKHAKSIRLDGMDWLFAQRKISTMGDESLELAIEYHRAILNGLLSEREARRVAYAHRNAGLPLPKSSPAKDTATVSKQVTKVTKEIKSTKASAGANSVMQSLLAKGLKPEQIMAMLATLQAKK